MKKIGLFVFCFCIFVIGVFGVYTIDANASELTLIDRVYWGDITNVSNLIKNGADVNERSSNGWTPLMWAAKKGNFDILKMLLGSRAKVNLKSNKGDTALSIAAREGHEDIVSLLLEKNADFGVVNNDGKTPLQLAEEKGHRSVMKLLMKAQAKENAEMAALSPQLQTPLQTPTAQIKLPEFNRPRSLIDNIPDFNARLRENDLAVIIGIEGYQSLPKSDYSYDDAKLVKDYLKALGFKERNIELLTDERATKSGIEKTIEAWLPNRIKQDSKIFVYYSGHGAPEPKTGDAYIVPFDGDPNYLEVTGYPLKRLYDKLGKLQAAEIVVALDSCFSGAGGRSVLAKGARPLVMMTEGVVLSQNMAVLSATQGTQISTSNSEKGHGVFTYHFLKALKDGKKNIAEIYEYIKPSVEDEAKTLNVQQSPSLNPDPEKLRGRFSLRK